MTEPAFTSKMGEYLWRLSELKQQRQFATDLLAACQAAEPEDAGDLETILDMERQARQLLAILNEVLSHA